MGRKLKTATVEAKTLRRSQPGAADRAPKRAGRSRNKVNLTTKAAQAVRRAEELLWGAGIPPHALLQELHETLLLRCLRETDGNYAAAAAIFGPSRQSVQQYANSPLRDGRWRPYQQNRRRKRAEM